MVCVVYPGRMGGVRRVLGINVAANVAYLAAVEWPSVVILNITPKIEPPNNEEDDWDQLRIFGDRVVQEAKAVGAGAVVFAQTRRPSQWTYGQAYSRVSLIVAAGLALNAAQIDARIVSQKSAAVTLGIKYGKQLEAELAAKLDIRPGDVVHWKQRGAGLAVALHFMNKRS